MTRKSPSVLIVDDALFMRTVLKDILTKNGYDVVGEATNGYEAIEKYQELHPDITTMDITMPELDGIEALKKIMEVDSNARVIMCSAMGQQGIVVEAIKHGACDFIIKPFQPTRVLEALEKAVQVAAEG
ncbi:MAG: response regulator [Candidatus Caenarcaniphilales bacterium]|nr:response regulator [Candidatus Caenarcaniphilales bacterium]